MDYPLPLDPAALYHACDPQTLDFDTTETLEDLTEVIGQERAVDAVRFGMGMRRDGYNLFVLGPPGIGKHTLVRRFLEKEAAAGSPPSDWCYVNNFDQAHRPRALRLPTGRGSRLQRDMQELVEELRTAIPAIFESDEYRARHEELDKELGELENKGFRELGQEAEQQGIALLRTPAGFAFAPVRAGEVIAPDEFEKLSDEEKQRIGATISGLHERLQKLLQQAPQWMKQRRERLKALNREFTMLAVSQSITELKTRYAELPDTVAYLERVHQDLIENAEEFQRPQEAQPPLMGLQPDKSAWFNRYRVNLLVEHLENQGVPVVLEDRPSFQELVGRVEHLAHFGALVTDFTLIKAGALHKANGGYLLLDAVKLLTQPFAWDALKRALYAKEIRVDSLGQMLSLVSTVSLEPEPIPLDIKVVLFGDRMVYYLLQEADPDFRELFKVAADFEETMPRTPDAHRLYARLVATLVRRENLLPLERGAVARLIEQASRIAGDREKISAHLQSLSDLVRESDYWARQQSAPRIARGHVQQAVDAQIQRLDRLRERVHEAILRGTVHIDTEGAQVGQVNGLSVFLLSNLAFGQPTRITATVRLGEGEVIDIEREVKLGGAIHSKGVLILSSLLASRYAARQPLSLTASLVFEQSYGGVEGDSASVAEFCALLSAIADIPLLQSLAVTGSLDQHGRVQAIGGVNEKIEGFFDICRTRGLTGRQGVLIPAANAPHLMLRHDVVEAAAQGRFRIYPVAHIDEAVSLLTGIPAGTPDSRGLMPADSVSQRVAERLKAFTAIRRRYAKPEQQQRRGKQP